MKIITAGDKYLDIDAYAGCVAYAELWNCLGIKAAAVSTAPLNQSIPQFIREWPTGMLTTYDPSEDDTFTLIDVSEPDYFEVFVDHSRIDEVIDHHPGFEEYWQQQIGDGAIIEHVGAACTQVFELWEQAGLAGQMSETSARLLMCGILDNTLNFGAEITTDRDHHAYAELSKIANVPDDWAAQYFDACQQEITTDLPQSLKDDLKIMSDLKTFGQPVAVGQLAIWDAGEMAAESFDVFKQQLGDVKPFWFVNLIGIHDKKSFFVTDAPEVKRGLEKLLAVQFDGNVAAADRMWLRKEIKKADIVTA